MISEKVGLSGWITLEFLTDSVYSPDTICDLFRLRLAKWCAEQGYILLPGCRVYFHVPDLDEPVPGPEMLKVRAIGRAVPVQKFPQYTSGTEGWARA